MKSGIIIATDLPLPKAARWVQEIEQRLILRHRMTTDVILAVAHDAARHKATDVDIVLINSTIEQADTAKEHVLELAGESVGP